MNVKHDIKDILDVGMRLFRLNGYHNTGTIEIIKEAGISRGSFYNFFTDKEDFGIQVLQHYTRGAVDYMMRSLNDPNKSPLNCIVDMFDDFIDTYRTLNFKWGCLLAGFSLELSRVEPNFENHTHNEFELYVGCLEKALLRAQEINEIRTDKSARELSIAIFSLYNGALLMMKAGMLDEPLIIFQKNMMELLK